MEGGMYLFSLFAFAIVGLGSGLLAGLLGMSGGIVTVPCLLFIFSLMGFPSVALMQLAIGTSLAAMVFNSLSSTYAHHRRGGVNWKLVRRLIPGLICGCIIGAFLGHILPNHVLQLIFGIFAILLGFYFYLHKEFSDVETHSLPNRIILSLVGLIVGGISNILGIGGGTMSVPLFVSFRLSMKEAIATSAATGFLITLTGAIAYLIFGLGEKHYAHTFGYIYLPAFAILAVTTFIAAPYGASLTHTMDKDRLKRYFALSLMAVGLVMVFS